MRRFIQNILLFIIPLLLILCSGLLLPPSPRASGSLLFANIRKDSLLLHTAHPRIIFVGGSNLSFGLNSRMIRDSLLLNPINTAVHGNIGVRYYLENTLQYVQHDDIVIVALEYNHFFRSYDYVSDELLRTIADVCPGNYPLLSFQQKMDLLLHYVPKFSLSKFKPTEYFGYEEHDIYSVNSFNEYGDVDAHWTLEDRGYQPTELNGTLNMEIFSKLKEFEYKCIEKGAKVYVTFTSIDEVSFNNSKHHITTIENLLKEHGFNLLGSAERYAFPPEMIFNGDYHLNKKGVDCRTRLFIEDFKNREKSSETIENDEALAG